MRFDIEVPSFTGFYQGIWDQSENEYCEIQSHSYGEYDEDGFGNLNFLDEWGFGSDYQDNVAQLFTEEYVKMIKTNLGIELELVGSYVRSPREYNFTTDRIFAIIDVPDYEALVENLLKWADDPKYRTVIAQAIKENHTSYDGFWSWMSNDIEKWFNLMLDPDNAHYISYFIGYLLDAVCPEEVEGLNEAIWCYVSGNTDYHCVEPESDEAKEEWELYQKYGTFYSDFAAEHSLNHYDPQHPCDLCTEDWDEYKELFMEAVKARDKELKRKAMIDAQPIIPGILDNND